MEVQPMQGSIQRRVLAVLVAVVTSMLLLAVDAGVAWALNVDCTTDFAVLCEGTNARDEFEGEDVDDGVDGARDIIEGKRSSDRAHGNGGNDRILGGKGADGEVGSQLSGDACNDYLDGGPGDDDNVKGGIG